jgi:hypothetical protein
MTQTVNAKAPVARARKVGTKKELIEQVKSASGDLWIDNLNSDKGLSGVSNKKLLRLQAIFTKAKERFSSREQIVDAIVAGEGRGKDSDYKKHFGDWSVPRLMDRLGAVEKAKKAADKKAAAKAAKPAKAAAKPAAAAAAKPAAAKPAAKPAAAKPAAKPAKKK